MLNREQRRKDNQNSLIPPTNRHITTDVTVTPTKLDGNKNNNKSRLFSTTCSRRAQEEKNYNKRAIINNKNLSSFYLPKQKMNIKTTPTKNNNNNNNTTFRKSPLIQLKQDLERLRQQKLEDESLIQRQTQEIIELKKKLIKTKELELQLLKKATIETKSTLVNIEIKKLSTDVIDLLQVTKSSDQTINNKEIVEKLQKQLETQEADFKKKLEQYTILTIEINQNIQSNQKLLNKLKVDHAIEISQLHLIYKDQLNRLKFDHKQELIKLKKKKQCIITNLNNFDHILEQALLEFEQEQHNHIPTIIQHDSNNKSLHGKIIPAMKNQQWYSKKYLPVDAISWPTPQLLPNLKKLNHHSR